MLYVSNEGVPTPSNFERKYELKNGIITFVNLPPGYRRAYYSFYAGDKSDVVVEGYPKIGSNYFSLLKNFGTAIIQILNL